MNLQSNDGKEDEEKARTKSECKARESDARKTKEEILKLDNDYEN